MVVYIRCIFLSWLLAAVGGFALFFATPVQAQETVSGTSTERAAQDGRVLKALSAYQSDIELLHENAKKTKMHVRVAPPTCTGNNKIYWNGMAWSCVAESDPRAMPFAKVNLPSCTPSQVLTATSTTVLSCLTPAGGAKGTIPNYGWSGTSLRFEKPDGSWGSYVNLKGPPGDNVVCP